MLFLSFSSKDLNKNHELFILANVFKENETFRELCTVVQSLGMSYSPCLCLSCMNSRFELQGCASAFLNNTHPDDA